MSKRKTIKAGKANQYLKLLLQSIQVVHGLVWIVLKIGPFV